MKTKKNLLRLIALFILIAMVASVLGACFADENKDNDEQQNQQPAESNNGNGDDTPDNGNGSGNDQPDVPADEISIVFNDGAGNTETVRVKQGEIVEAPAAPERDGYVFCGWYIEDLGVAYNFDQPLPADTQLKAKWEFDYVAFDQIDVSEFLLKDVGVRIDLSELDFVLLNGDDSRSITSDGPATLFVELNEDGDPYGVVTGSILMSTDYGVANVSYIKAILEDGVVYLEVESEGEFTQARMPLATFFANMFNVDASMVLSLMDDPEQTLEGLAEAYGLEGIPAPIYNMVSQAGQLAAAVAPITMAAVLDVFFTKDTIDGRDYYVLDYDKIAAFNDNLEDLTVAEFINTYAGEAVYETVKLAVRYLLYTPVGNLIDMIDGYISVDALIAYVAGFFPEGITEEQIRVMLAAPELKEATLLDLVAAQQKDSICEAVEAAFAACESNSVYGLIALLAQQSGQSGEYAESDNDFDSEDDGVDPLISANEEEEEIALDLHAIVGELIEIMRDSVSYSFIMEDGKLLAESLDVIDFNLVLDEDVELLVSFCLEADFVDPSFEPEWSEELKSSIDSKKILADVKSMSLYENDDDGSSRTEQLIVDWVNGELPQVYVLTYTKDVYEGEEGEENEEGEWVWRNVYREESRTYYALYRLTDSNGAVDGAFYVISRSYGENNYIRFELTASGSVMTIYSKFSRYADDPQGVVHYYNEWGEEVDEEPAPETENFSSMTLVFYVDAANGEVISESRYQKLMCESGFHRPYTEEIDFHEQYGCCGNLVISQTWCLMCGERLDFTTSGQPDCSYELVDGLDEEEIADGYATMSWRCSDCNLLIESSGPVDESGNPILEDWYVTVYVIETDGEEEWSNYVVGAPATDLLSLIST